MIEIPIFMIWIVCFAFGGSLVTIWATAVTGNSWKQKAKRLEDRQPTVVRSTLKPSLVSDKKHGLKSLYEYNTSGSAWSWGCECGHGEIARIKPEHVEKGISCEELAMIEWRAHVATHMKYLVPTHEHSHAKCDQRFVGLWTIFERYRKACYCQTANDELILLNQEVKELEPPKEKTEEK